MGKGTRPTPAVCSIVADKIIEACERHWDTYKGDCSGFVKAVAEDLGVILGGQANQIVDHIQTDDLWWTLKDGVEALDWAEAGYFVLAGLKAQPNGHVAVIAPGGLAHGKYPTGYWGSLGGVGKKKTTINYSWNLTDRDKVIYASTLIDHSASASASW